MSQTIFITGGAGYVGGMLCEQLSALPQVTKIIALDKDEMPESLKGNQKIVWITANTADKDDWWDKVAKENPDVVIHTAWQIRELYGRQHIEWRWNVEGSQRIFEFAFSSPSVKRIVYFSTASIYGAYATNTLDHLFTEDEPMREEEYSYGREKKRAEEILHTLYEEKKNTGVMTPIVSVVRPAAITGPRGRFMRVRFGLQSALMGNLTGNFFYRLVTLLVSYVPATPWWVRQYIHEDDVNDIVTLLAIDEKVSHQYEIFNITPPGEPVYAQQMAEIAHKKILHVWPWMVRLAFFIFWHISRGKIPNGRGVWRFYSYPIVMSGKKLIDMYGYQYKYSPRDAFAYTHGRYEMYVPKEKQVKKS